MAKNKTFLLYLSALSLVVIFLSGCLYLNHFDEAMRMQELAANQQEMQAELDREDESFKKLKADINCGRLKKLTRKRTLVNRYGEPTSCKPSQGSSDIKEACFYRNPAGGLLTQIIVLNFNAKNRLCSWQIEGPAK